VLTLSPAQAHTADVLSLFPAHLRSVRHPGAPLQRKAVGAMAPALAMALALVLCSCAAGDPQFTSQHAAGFWLGIWHGMISWVTLIVGLFDPGVHIYERNNTGGWYDFGFLIGATGIMGGGGRMRRRSANTAR
jgi:hypothetical protein